jgi:hypothetical protein
MEARFLLAVALAWRGTPPRDMFPMSAEEFVIDDDEFFIIEIRDAMLRSRRVRLWQG